MIADFIISAIKERCAALDSELIRLRAKQFPSVGPTTLLNLVKKANELILTKVDQLEKSQELRKTITDEQFEYTVNRFARLLPFLHELLSFLEGAERKGASFRFARPIRRFMQRYLPECEVIFASKPELNYSFQEISAYINKVFKEAGLNEVCQYFPPFFIIISFPQAEAENILLHCIFAHEICHGIYLRENLIDKILKKVRISKKEIQRFSTQLFSAIQKQSTGKSKQLPLYPQEIQLREAITEEINKSVESWADELTSDSIAVCLFWTCLPLCLHPAYFVTAVRCVLSFSSLSQVEIAFDF